MPFLLRVELPDVPGSLGRVASAIGEAGGDIEAIEIVEKRHDEETAVDDVLLEVMPGTMPDSIVSACNALDGVAGGLDQPVRRRRQPLPRPRGRRGADRRPGRRARPAHRPAAGDLPRRVGGAGQRQRRASSTPPTGAPEDLAFTSIGKAARLETPDDNVHVGARLNKHEIVVIGRRGGPEFLDSELARLGHLVALAMSISRAG